VGNAGVYFAGDLCKVLVRNTADTYHFETATSPPSQPRLMGIAPASTATNCPTLCSCRIIIMEQKTKACKPNIVTCRKWVPKLSGRQWCSVWQPFQQY
jgi:hypothetical protein